MTNTAKPFVWKNRDTFARDLIQLVYHAPSEISARALRLLEHLGSAAVVPELHALVLDVDWPPSMRVYALRGVINSPGDVYIPEIRPFLDSPDFQRLAIGRVIKYDALDLADQHPSNRLWLLDYVEHMPPEQQRNTLCDFLHENRLVISSLQSAWRYMLCDSLISLLKTHPALLDLHAAGLLHRKDDRQSSQEWLTARTSAIVELCLEAQIEDFAYVLDDWERLKQIYS